MNCAYIPNKSQSQSTTAPFKKSKWRSLQDNQIQDIDWLEKQLPK